MRFCTSSFPWVFRCKLTPKEYLSKRLISIQHDPTLLFQQQTGAAGTSFSMPVVGFALRDTAFALPPFDFSHVKRKTCAENCVSYPVQAVLLKVFPFLQLITILITVTPQLFTAPITTNSSLATQFSQLSCCTTLSPRVK